MERLLQFYLYNCMAHGTFKHNELMMGCHGINTGILEMKCISVYAIDVNIYIYIYTYNN